MKRNFPNWEKDQPFMNFYGILLLPKLYCQIAILHSDFGLLIAVMSQFFKNVLRVVPIYDAIINNFQLPVVLINCDKRDTKKALTFWKQNNRLLSLI